MILLQNSLFYIIKNIISYIYPKIKIKRGTFKTHINSTQRAKYFEDHFKSIVNANYIIFGDNFKFFLYSYSIMSLMSCDF